MIWIGLILVIIGIVCLIFITKENCQDVLGIVTAMIIGGAILACNAGEKSHQPTALDVYQGKTTLEITYIDGVAIDSVVVYKNLDYGK